MIVAKLVNDMDSLFFLLGGMQFLRRPCISSTVIFLERKYDDFAQDTEILIYQ